MKTIIIEDEVSAVNNLKAIFMEMASELEIVATLDSIGSSVNYFAGHEMPDLIFMDIQLADGNSFSIFSKVEITCPVIFTTAYDSYALEAFKVNSIDYLLKPIEPDDVRRALTKLKHLSKAGREDYTRKYRKVFSVESEFTRTLLINYRDRLIPVPTSQIAYFYTKDDVIFCTSFEGKEWIMDKSLDTIMSTLDPSLFFRANRQFIVSHKAIGEVVVWFGNRLALILSVKTPEKIIISKANVSSFKKWIVKNYH